MRAENNHNLDERVKAPIIVTGLHRTGTTLLCRVLNTHPNIFIGNGIPTATQNIPSIGMSRSDYLDSINVAFEKKFQCGLGEYLANEKKNRWGNKAANIMLYHMEDFIRIFPDAKFIITLRDGRAQANSVLNGKWGDANIYHAANLWLKQMQQQTSYLEKYRQNLLLVKYENFVSNMKDELIRICEFIDEPFDENMLNYHEQKTHISTTEGSKNTAKKPNSAFIDKWKSELSQFEINVFETIAGEELARNNYPLVGNKIEISWILKFWFNLHQKVMGEVQLQMKRKHWR